MSGPTLSTSEMERVCEDVRRFRMTLAVIRSNEAPQQLERLFEDVSNRCLLPLVRVISSPLSDFGFAEFNSNGKMLVMLFIGGARTELVSVSETNEMFVQDMEDSVSASNIQSSIIRDGL